MSIFPERWMGRIIPTHNIPKTYTKDGKVYCTFTGKKIKKKKNKKRTMTLKEKFDKVEIMFENQVGSLKYDELSEASNQCEKIAEQFAIEFANWVDNLVIESNHVYCSNSIGELLEIYKKEKQ